MWQWEQGRLGYFQFDELRKIAKFAASNDLRMTERASLEAATGLPFPPDTQEYKPWRNYGRLFQLVLIVAPDEGSGSTVTEVGKLLAEGGKITTDDYFHFLARAVTDPSPAFSNWNPEAEFRYPLLFALRFLLARATQGEFTTLISQIIGVYEAKRYCGDENQTDFLRIIDLDVKPRKEYRQAAESLKVVAQISYLTATKNEITVSLNPEDAASLFQDLAPVSGPRQIRRTDELLRIAKLFPSAQAELDLNFPATVMDDAKQAGFEEGGRVKRTHLTIERNWKIRSAFFEANPSCDCDFCGMDTRLTYPWMSKVLDIHHLLPLCSGIRTSTAGTLLEDLVANCPSCHRAVHGYYDKWLRKYGQTDFIDAHQSKQVYREAKHRHRRACSV